MGRATKKLIRPLLTYTSADVAALVARDTATVRKWAASGLLPRPLGGGRHLRWTRQSIHEFLTAQGYPVPDLAEEGGAA